MDGWPDQWMTQVMATTQPFENAKSFFLFFFFWRRKEIDDASFVQH